MDTNVELFVNPSNNIKFSLMSCEDIEEVQECFTKTFVEGNPITMAVNITENEFKVYSQYVCQKIAEDGLSVIARDAVTGKLMGCRLLEPEYDLNDISGLSDKFSPVFSFLQEMSINIPEIANHKKMVHFLAIGVNKQYQGLGLAKMLMAMQLFVLSEKHYDYFTIELVNPYSYRAILSVLSSESRYQKEICYAGFIHQDTRPFAGIPERAISFLSPVDNLKPDIKKWAQLQADRDEIFFKNTYGLRK